MPHPANTHRRTTGLAPMVMVALACTGLPVCGGPFEPDSPTGVEAAREARVDRPAGTRAMKMDFTVLFTGPVENPLPECLAGHASSVLEGQATHLGRFTGVGSTCILSVTPDPDPPCVPAASPPWASAPFTNPRWELTAADGDELWLESDDAVAVLAVNPDGSYRALCAQGTTRIIGGTGRFAGAAGELETMAVNEDGQGPDDARSEGWIRY